MSLPEPYYVDEAVTLYHGDARAIVPLLGLADIVITDPPYDARTHAGARWHDAELGRTGALGKVGGRIAFEPLGPVEDVIALLAAARWSLAFCALEMLGEYRTAAADRWVRAGLWYRPNGAPQFTGDRPAQPGEGIAIWHRRGRKHWNGGGRAAFFACGVERRNRIHPTQKPAALLAELVALFSDPGELICDPFAGSGTTLVAAKRLGRRAIGVELDAAYCALAADRLAQSALPLTFEPAEAQAALPRDVDGDPCDCAQCLGIDVEDREGEL